MRCWLLASPLLRLLSSDDKAKIRVVPVHRPFSKRHDKPMFVPVEFQDVADAGRPGDGGCPKRRLGRRIVFWELDFDFRTHIGVAFRVWVEELAS